MTFPVKREKRIGPEQVVVESVGQTHRHLIVNLRNEMTINWLRETPEAWVGWQSSPSQALRRGDEVSAVSPDGLTRADRMTVLRAEAGKVWLGAPLRLVQFDEVALYENPTYEVVPIGTHYGIRTRRDGHLDKNVYSTVDAAKNEILRRRPTKAA